MDLSHHSRPAANAQGQTRIYKASYDPGSGRIEIWRDGAYVGSWTDPSPLQSGSYLSLRTNTTDASFDNLVVEQETKYYYAGSERVGLRVGNSAVQWLISDHLGSTSVTADAAGNRQGELWYKPYGASRSGWGTTPTQHRYTGQTLDGVGGGLYYYGARYYDPVLGRFISPDTIVPDPGNPQALNRYSYVLNNPLRWIDPSGHKACEAAYDCENTWWEDELAGGARFSIYELGQGGQYGFAKLGQHQIPIYVPAPVRSYLTADGLMPLDRDTSKDPLAYVPASEVLDCWSCEAVAGKRAMKPNTWKNAYQQTRFGEQNIWDFLKGLGVGLNNQPESTISVNPTRAERNANAAAVVGFMAEGARDYKFTSTFVMQESLTTDGARVIIQTSSPNWPNQSFYVSNQDVRRLTPVTSWPWGQIRPGR